MLIFVTGMHRSGTSLFARMLNRLGVAVPGDLLPANSDNPTGYWEAREIVQLNNEILEACGLSWCDDRNLTGEQFSELSEHFRPKIIKVLETLYLNDSLTALKDPRFSRLLPLWIEAVEALGIEYRVFFMVRNPVEISQSLFQRVYEQRSRPAAILNATKAHCLSVRYMLDAERHSRCSKRAFVCYRDLIDDPILTLTRCFNQADISFKIRPDLVEFANPDLHRQKGQPPESPLQPSAMFSVGVFQILERMARGRSDSVPHQHLDNLLEEFDQTKVHIDRVRGDEAAKTKERQAPFAQIEAEFTARNSASQATGRRTPRVVFLSGAPTSKGHIYRIQNRIEAALTTDISATYLDLTDPNISNAVKFSDIIVVFRAQWSPELESIYQMAQSQSKPVVFDIDDLVFDPRYMFAKYFAFLADISPEQQDDWKNRAKNYLTALKQADAVWTTTETLAVHIRRFNQNCHVVPNGISSARLHHASDVLSKKALRSGNRRVNDIVRIGYASGTATHYRDFAQVIPALTAVMHAHSNAYLTLLGAIQLSRYPELAEFSDRIEHWEAVPFSQLPDELSKFDINIAPLEANNPFCDAKSELKYFESGIVAVPTIASATPPFSTAITQGETSFVAENTGDWIAHLTQLIEDSKRRESVGRAARNDCIQHWGPVPQQQAFMSAIAKLV